jgi:hypothetical protein
MSQNKKSYVPEVPWPEHLAEWAKRHTYTPPTPAPHGPHPRVDGTPVPGGRPYCGRGKPKGSRGG